MEDGENPLSAIKRELQEESGYKASKWDSLGEMIPAPGYADEVIHLFLARDLEKLKELLSRISIYWEHMDDEKVDYIQAVQNAIEHKKDWIKLERDI